MTYTAEEANTDMTFHESYGYMPKVMLAMVKRHNVSPADYLMLEMEFGTDWDSMRQFIRDNLRGRSFYYPFGGKAR